VTFNQRIFMPFVCSRPLARASLMLTLHSWGSRPRLYADAYFAG
jgi:hypothetical protein